MHVWLCVDVCAHTPHCTALYSTIALESEGAKFLGKEAALYCVSSTQCNLIAAVLHCRGQGWSGEMILGDESHIHLYESGASALFGGVHSTLVPTAQDGTLSLEDIEKKVRGPNVHFAVPRLVCIENTHNKKGGRALPVEYMDALGEKVHALGLQLHCDGARLPNAAIKLGVSPARLVQGCDTVSMCLSKGLGAPVGSLLAGSQAFIAQARNVRKALGGGMRQSGVIAAPGLLALHTMYERLVEDHELAQDLIAYITDSLPHVRAWGETNIVLIALEGHGMPDADTCIEKLAADKLLVSNFGPYVRVCFHHQVTLEGVELLKQKLHALTQNK